MQDEQTCVHYGFAYKRNVVEHVYGLLDACRCIDVPSEFRTDALEVFQDALVREILCPVEAHVLEEMRQTVLVRGLLDCAYIRGEIEFRPVGRLVVVPDVIGEPVVKLACADRRVIRQLGKL